MNVEMEDDRLGLFEDVEAMTCVMEARGQHLDDRRWRWECPVSPEGLQRGLHPQL